MSGGMWLGISFGISSGTTASALVSWQPVPGALSYSIRRFNPNANRVQHDSCDHDDIMD